MAAEPIPSNNRNLFSRLRRNPLPPCANSGCAGRRHTWRNLWQCHGGVYIHASWYCSPQCLEQALEEKFAARNHAVQPAAPARHRIPLGLMLLSRGQLDNRQLRSALEAQRAHGGRLGGWLEKLGYATEQQVTAALGMQWACPVLPILSAAQLPYARMAPSHLLRHFRMWPVRFVEQTRMLYIAFSDKVDYCALQAVGHILDCGTDPCLTTNAAMRMALEQLEREKFANELLFAAEDGPAEMAHIASGYILKLGARRVRMAFCREYVWLRLQAERGHTDLLFHSPLPAATFLSRLGGDAAQWPARVLA